MKFLYSYCDVAEAWQLGIQDPATPSAEGMYSFHLFLLSVLFLVGVLVCWIMGFILYHFNEKTNKNALLFTHSSLLEIIWTIFPAVVLLFISIPSFSLLYSLDEVIDPSITVKIIGHQWYWTYEMSDFNEKEVFLKYDSYMVSSDDLTLGSFRLLEVDNRLVLPVNRHIRLLITSADVLHSWAVPSLGIKTDACPGRLNQASLFIKRIGTFYGQCSEICGVNHGFMPITVRSVKDQVYYTWVVNKVKSIM